MNNKAIHFMITFTVGLGLALATLSLLGGSRATRAAPEAELHVCPSGCAYSSIQAAVDAASSGDVIKVAAGTYSGTQTKLSTTTAYTYTQVVFIDGKSLTLKGGYTASDWNVYDPLNNPTIIDAQNYGRGITIVGNGTQTVTIAGFQIVNGDYTNLGNAAGVANAACPATGGDCAGGLLAYQVKLILQDSLIRNNTASRIRPYSSGGGALFWKVLDGTLIDNVQVFSNTNTVEGYGGGIYVSRTQGGITFRNCQFDQNHSTFDGGGLVIYDVKGTTTIQNCRFTNNTAVGRYDAQGGAIDIASEYDVILDRVELRGNRASENGAAIIASPIGTGNPTLRLVNVLAAENRLTQAASHGSTINVVGGTAGTFHLQIVHTTVADNLTPGAIRIAQWPIDAISYSADLTNTLITSATYGLVGAEYTGTLTINHTNTLFYTVTNQTAAETGTPTFNGTGTVTGDPKLDSIQRLQTGSAAIDAGVNSGISLDLDNGLRPGGSGYDIGADEYNAAAPGSFRFSQAAYAVNEGETITITVQRVGGTAGTVSVQYASSDGTATAGTDYTAASGTLNFADGVASQTFTVTTTEDTTSEADETLVLALSNPSGGATLSTPNQAVLTIQDDDVSTAGEIRFSSSTYTVTESAGTATITVTRVSGSTGAVSVDFNTSDGTAIAGSDYIATSGTLNFADGETTKTITIVILLDSVSESDEALNVVLSNVTGGATLGSPNQAVLTIENAYAIFLPLLVR